MGACDWNGMTYGASRNILQADLGSSSGSCEEERDVDELHCEGCGEKEWPDGLDEGMAG